MTDARIIAYKQSLKGRYTGMTEELMKQIEGIKVTDKIDYDLNRDGVIDHKDVSIAGKLLKKQQRVK